MYHRPKCKTIKRLKESIRGNLCKLGFADKLLDITSEMHSMIENVVNYT